MHDRNPEERLWSFGPGCYCGGEQLVRVRIHLIRRVYRFFLEKCSETARLLVLITGNAFLLRWGKPWEQQGLGEKIRYGFQTEDFF